MQGKRKTKDAQISFRANAAVKLAALRMAEEDGKSLGVFVDGLIREEAKRRRAPIKAEDDGAE